MRKTFFVVVLAILFLVTGCGEKEGVLVCEKKQAIDTTTSLKSTYRVSYRNGYVKKLDTVEVIESDNEEVLSTYKEKLESIYKDYNDIEYYKNEIEIKDKKLISTTKVDYEHIDTSKLVEIDKNNAAAIENGKVKVAVLKEAYEQIDATCKEEK